MIRTIQLQIRMISLTARLIKNTSNPPVNRRVAILDQPGVRF